MTTLRGFKAHLCDQIRRNEMESTELYFARIAFNAYHGYPKDNHFEFYDRSKKIQSDWAKAARAIASHIADGFAEQMDF